MDFKLGINTGITLLFLCSPCVNAENRVPAKGPYQSLLRETQQKIFATISAVDRLKVANDFIDHISRLKEDLPKLLKEKKTTKSFSRWIIALSVDLENLPKKSIDQKECAQAHLNFLASLSPNPSDQMAILRTSPHKEVLELLNSLCGSSNQP